MLATAQDLLYAADTWSVLLVFQAMDAAGKDSTIKQVMSGINPQGARSLVQSRQHRKRWITTSCGGRGAGSGARADWHIQRSYEEVLVVPVHPELVRGRRIPAREKVNEEPWAGRYESINCLEQHLSRNGTKIIKFFLERFQGRAGRAVPGTDSRSAETLEAFCRRHGGAEILRTTTHRRRRHLLDTDPAARRRLLGTLFRPIIKWVCQRAGQHRRQRFNRST